MRTTIELFKEDMKFSSGHFTIFSETRRERLHGHNFVVHAGLILAETTAETTVDCLNFDYADYKLKIRSLCQALDEFFLLPSQSPYLQIHEAGDHYRLLFNQETLFFPKQDVKLLPLANITVESLAEWFVQALTQDPQVLKHDGIASLWVKVFSGPGQCASVHWPV